MFLWLSCKVSVSHKNITNPSITHADKVMHAISACAAALRGVAGGRTPKELQDLQQIIEIAGRTVSKNASAMEQANAQHAAQAPRVEPTPERPVIETRPAPRVRAPTPAPAPRDTTTMRLRSRRRALTPMPTDGPAKRTRGARAAASAAATAATAAAQAAAASARAAIAAARPAANTRSRRVSGLPQPTDVTTRRT